LIEGGDEGDEDWFIIFDRYCNL